MRIPWRQLLDEVEGPVEKPLGDRLLALEHEPVGELGVERAPLAFGDSLANSSHAAEVCAVERN